MSLIFTPGQLSRRADFYHRLGQLLGAGLGLTQALEQLKRNPPARSYHAPVERVLEQINAGGTLTDALREQGHWLPAFDIALLEASEMSGRLDAGLRMLADYYTDRARLGRRFISDLAYPAFVLHFAVFIFPFPQFFLTGNWVVYLTQTLRVLLPLYAVVGLLLFMAQNRHGEAWRAGLERVLHLIPVLGRARQYLALARLCAALEALLSAGITVIEAWEMAATASGSPRVRRAVLSWRPRLDAGQTPAEVVSDSRCFPELFASQYATGEISGRLDDTLRRLRGYYQEEGTRKLHAAAQWMARGVYLAVVLMIAARILGFYMGYFSMVRDAGGF